MNCLLPLAMLAYVPLCEAKIQGFISFLKKEQQNQKHTRHHKKDEALGKTYNRIKQIHRKQVYQAINHDS